MIRCDFEGCWNEADRVLHAYVPNGVKKQEVLMGLRPTPVFEVVFVRCREHEGRLFPPESPEAQELLVFRISIIPIELGLRAYGHLFAQEIHDA